VKVSGSAVLNASRDRVWEALIDPAVLVCTIPGCQRLETITDDTYRMTLTAGVASIKGVYEGEVSLTEQQPPDTFVLKAAGSGAPGTVSAHVAVRLDDTTDSTTTLTYDADAVVGGMIGGVGQRMLTGVAKKTAGEFFAAVDDVLTGKASAATPGTPDSTSPLSTSPGSTSPDSTARPALSPANAAATARGDRVFEAPGAAAALATAGGGDFARGVLVGAGAALLGALVGGWLVGRRRTD
jgi:uncharacterized protein